MKSGLVSMTISVPSRRSLSRTGRQKVPTPGPYSTNSSHAPQSTGPSILATVKRDDGMIEPTMRSSSTKPRKKTPPLPEQAADALPEVGPAKRGGGLIDRQVRNPDSALPGGEARFDSVWQRHCKHRRCGLASAAWRITIPRRR